MADWASKMNVNFAVTGHASSGGTVKTLISIELEGQRARYSLPNYRIYCPLRSVQTHYDLQRRCCRTPMTTSERPFRIAAGSLLAEEVHQTCWGLYGLNQYRGCVRKSEAAQDQN